MLCAAAGCHLKQCFYLAHLGLKGELQACAAPCHPMHRLGERPIWGSSCA